MLYCIYSLGICSLGSAALSGLFARFCCVPRVSYRALPSFHPGLCRRVALSGLISPFICVPPGFHIGLCPHSTLGYAGVSPLQGSLSCFCCFPRFSYRALPSFHPGLCWSAALAGLIYVITTNQLRCCFDAVALFSCFFHHIISHILFVRLMIERTKA